MIQIAILGIAAALLASQLKNMKSDYHIYVMLSAAMVIFFYMYAKIEDMVEAINKIQGYVKLESSYMAVLVKIIGITYIAELASSICKDTGHSTIAAQIEMFAKLSIMAFSMPILLALLETINQFLS